MQDRRAALLWLALAVALSAPLVDLAIHVATTPSARATALFLPLFVYSAWTDPKRSRPARDGPLWVVLGLALSLVAVAGGMTRVGRPGIAIAAIGMARALGSPSTPRAALAAWLVPVPSVLQAALAPGLAGLVAAAAQQIGVRSGIEATLDPNRVGRLVFSVPSGSLDLVPEDAGLALAWAFAGIGWFSALQDGAGIGALTRNALRWGIAAFALQAVALVLACAALFGGAAAFARPLLDQVPLVSVGAALALVLLRSRRSATRACA